MASLYGGSVVLGKVVEIKTKIITPDCFSSVLVPGYLDAFL